MEAITMVNIDANQAYDSKWSPTSGPFRAQLPRLFEEGLMFNLDFLDDPGQNVGLAESLMFSATEVW